MGCSEGNIYNFDPYLMSEGKITKYYYSRPPCMRKKKIAFVKWLQPIKSEDPSHFIVVYQEGQIYVYETNKEIPIQSVDSEDDLNKNEEMLAFMQ